jgi:hypothetical protein
MEKTNNALLIKSCYSHIGGKFGNRLTIRLEELGWITKAKDSKDFIVTAKGEKEFKKLGIDMEGL